MKILWVNGSFLHPTNRGGQIRTLEMLKRLHAVHEVHYVGFENPAEPEGVQRSHEYCSHVYPVQYVAPKRGSLAFAFQALGNIFTSLPLPVWRYKSAPMAEVIAGLRAREHFDSIVCDFVFPAPNLSHLEDCVVFEHNLETLIWKRHAETASNPVARMYFAEQARRMFHYERQVCRSAGLVIAVSPVDAAAMQRLFEAERVTHVATGVDIDFFRSPEEHKPDDRLRSDLVFVGSMDWMPNIDGVNFFCEQVLPLIRKDRPQCSLTIVGRNPPAQIRALAERDPYLRVTGTVDDIRPYLWNSAVSIVPLRIGSGTRLKIYESMAAQSPVISTTIGAEGLAIHPPDDIRIADTPQEFAAECLHLLGEEALRRKIANSALDMVTRRFGWDTVTSSFERMLSEGPRPRIRTR